MRQHSHSPYSRFRVGAALKLKGQAELILGTNVENASFGATLCAERVALTSAVARFGRIDPEFLVVATGEKQATVPCALCLQVLAEWVDDDFPIHLGNGRGLQRVVRFKDLLPEAFRRFKVR